MSNMSYCRFENTYHDLLDCFDHLFDDNLSSNEEKCRKKLIELCQTISLEIDEDEEEDEDEN